MSSRGVLLEGLRNPHLYDVPLSALQCAGRV